MAHRIEHGVNIGDDFGSVNTAEARSSHPGNAASAARRPGGPRTITSCEE
jgi:hypothetical protein